MGQLFMSGHPGRGGAAVGTVRRMAQPVHRCLTGRTKPL
jgi:hypothetical protein